MTHLQADVSHKAVSVRSWSAVLALLGLIILAGGGCASNNSPQALFGEYKKLLEQQKAGMPMEDDVTKKLPEMTAAGAAAPSSSTPSTVTGSLAVRTIWLADAETEPSAGAEETRVGAVLSNRTFARTEAVDGLPTES